MTLLTVSTTVTICSSPFWDVKDLCPSDKLTLGRSHKAPSTRSEPEAGCSTKAKGTKCSKIIKVQENVQRAQRSLSTTSFSRQAPPVSGCVRHPGLEPSTRQGRRGQRGPQSPRAQFQQHRGGTADTKPAEPGRSVMGSLSFVHLPVALSKPKVLLVQESCADFGFWLSKPLGCVSHW